MANHKSAAKRARQSIKRGERNSVLKSRVKTAGRKVLEAKDAKEAEAALSAGFSMIQKASKVLHRNTIKRKMARLARAAARLKKAS